MLSGEGSNKDNVKPGKETGRSPKNTKRKRKQMAAQLAQGPSTLSGEEAWGKAMGLQGKGEKSRAR